mgnify:CR=1 FL=1
MDDKTVVTVKVSETVNKGVVAFLEGIDDGTGEHIPLLDDPEGCLQLLAVVLHGLRGADFLCLRWFFRAMEDMEERPEEEMSGVEANQSEEILESGSSEEEISGQSSSPSDRFMPMTPMELLPVARRSVSRKRMHMPSFVTRNISGCRISPL